MLKYKRSTLYSYYPALIRRRWEAKQQGYRANGILPYQEGRGSAGTLIATYDNERGGISLPEIDAITRNVFRM